MKAVQFSRFGAPEVLETIELAMPVPAPHEALVRVRAAGVNFFEALMRSGRYGHPELPLRPGVEVVGVVEQVGAQVETQTARSLLGKRVVVPLFALGRAGAYTEYVTADAASVLLVPERISDLAASALLVQGLSALLLARHVPVKGKSVALNAAAGGVGSLLLQLLRRAGARQVIALTGTDDKRDIALSLGADFAFNDKQPDWPAELCSVSGGSVDVVFDAVGGAAGGIMLQTLAPQGTMVFSALNRYALTTAQMESIFGNNQSVRGFALLPLLDAATLKAGMAELFSLAASGELRILPGQSYPLEQAAAAHHALESGLSSGKIVLTVE
jgi:NADPH2:quinone reductase